MPNLAVPERFKPGIIKVASLEKAAFDELVAALERAPVCQDSRELVAWLTGDVPSLSASEQKEIVSSLVPMFRVQQGSNVSVGEFVDDVWDSISEDAEHIDESVFKDRISKLLNQAALDLAS